MQLNGKSNWSSDYSREDSELQIRVLQGERFATQHWIIVCAWNEHLPYPYCVEGSKELFDRIAFDMVEGITASAPGFFGPQAM